MNIKYAQTLFAYSHLMSASMRAVSKPYYEQAMLLFKVIPDDDNEERNISLRLLLQSKDAAVRAYVIHKRQLQSSAVSSDAGQESKSTTIPHDWIASTLGHGETMCRVCKVTNREAAVIGIANHCETAMELQSKKEQENEN